MTVIWPHLRARGSEPVALIDAAEFEAARRDPRVQQFLADSDRYLAELEARAEPAMIGATMREVHVDPPQPPLDRKLAELERRVAYLEGALGAIMDGEKLWEGPGLRRQLELHGRVLRALTSGVPERARRIMQEGDRA